MQRRGGVLWGTNNQVSLVGSHEAHEVKMTVVVALSGALSPVSHRELHLGRVVEEAVFQMSKNVQPSPRQPATVGSEQNEETKSPTEFETIQQELGHHHQTV